MLRSNEFGKMKTHLWFIITLIIVFLLMLNFLEYFPNGWDQAEYAWALNENYLPHSPYIVYFLLGKIFYWFLQDGARALSTLSLICGLVSLFLVYQINLRLIDAKDSKWQGTTTPLFFASMVTFLVGTNYLFIRQSSTQEVYIVQLSFVLLSAFFLLNSKDDRLVFGGVAYGCAIATHNSSLFFLPSIIFLALTTISQRKQSYHELLTKFCIPAASTVIIFYAFIYLLLPTSPTGNQWHYYLTYLRGISDDIELSESMEPDFILGSVQGLWHRVSSQTIPHERMPRASFPLAITPLHFLLIISGFVISSQTHQRQTIFWFLWSLPYILYEILIGNTPDFGIYIVFLLPALMPFLALVVTWTVGKVKLISNGKFFIHQIFVATFMVLLLLPSLFHFVLHWDDLNKDALNHYSVIRLAAAEAAEVLPQNSIVIQSRDEWNVNLLPYYVKRQHVLRSGNRLYLFKGLPFSPMNINSYEQMTTEKLEILLSSGKYVYAFEPDPFRDLSNDVLDEQSAQWKGNIELDLDQAKARLSIPEELSRQLSGGIFTLYQGSIVKNQ